MEILNIINSLMQKWVDSHWSIALVIAVFVNVAVYLATASMMERLIKYAVEVKSLATYVDNRTLKQNQVRKELLFGLSSCVFFAIGSLFSRELCSSLWPRSVSEFLVQILAFSIFYETYSYFVHRLLHTRLLLRYHGVHHSSVRCTPWSAYSVHPIEAIFIGLSAPIFMAVYPMSLGVALILHVLGMMFTIFIHSNFSIDNKGSLLKIMFAHPMCHSIHHLRGNVNYGFVNGFWDKLLKTKVSEKYEAET